MDNEPKGRRALMIFLAIRVIAAIALIVWLAFWFRHGRPA